jgi:hypothetical protein
MTRLEWNALRRGDGVAFHHPGGTDPLVSGTVAMINVLRGDNGVGIRLVESRSGPAVIWPTRHAVHVGEEGACWRCDPASR